MARERPARQLLAGIPFALPVVQQIARREALGEAAHEGGRIAALGGSEGLARPFRTLGIGRRNEGRLPTHGEPHVALGEIAVDFGTERHQALPRGLAEGQGHARLLGHAAHRHGVAHHRLAGLERAADRGRTLRLERAGERDVPLAGPQARGGIETDPAGPGEIDLAPGVEVGEIRTRPGGSGERLLVGHELDEVAGDEACREPETARDLDQEPARIPTRALALAQGLLGRPHAGLEPHDVADVARQALVEGHEEIDGAHRLERNLRDIALKPLAARPRPQERCELAVECFVVGEGKTFRRRLEEKVEGIDHPHVGHEVDSDREPVGLFGNHHASEEIALGVLLPVEEMGGGLDLERIGGDGSTRVRGRAQPHHLRSERNAPVVAVFRAMVEGDLYAHAAPLAAGAGRMPPRQSPRAAALCCGATLANSRPRHNWTRRAALGQGRRSANP